MEGSSKGMASRKGCTEGAAKVFQKREGSWKLPGNKQLQDFMRGLCGRGRFREGFRGSSIGVIRVLID